MIVLIHSSRHYDHSDLETRPGIDWLCNLNRLALLPGPGYGLAEGVARIRPVDTRRRKHLVEPTCERRIVLCLAQDVNI